MVRNAGGSGGLSCPSNPEPLHSERSQSQVAGNAGALSMETAKTFQDLRIRAGPLTEAAQPEFSTRNLKFSRA